VGGWAINVYNLRIVQSVCKSEMRETLDRKYSLGAMFSDRFDTSLSFFSLFLSSKRIPYFQFSAFPVVVGNLIESIKV
jgi:hypothetical protein